MSRTFSTEIPNAASHRLILAAREFQYGSVESPRCASYVDPYRMTAVEKARGVRLRNLGRLMLKDDTGEGCMVQWEEQASPLREGAKGGRCEKILLQHGAKGISLPSRRGIEPISPTAINFRVFCRVKA